MKLTTAIVLLTLLALPANAQDGGRVAFTTFIPLRRATALSSSKKDRANNKEARQLATLAI